ncbi:hypothetical protein [Novosphingobium sp.]|uniref:hypothetical protein n=1 Tax=Novosphingobium sp. TaxID=1874826 RepID=UPI002605AFA0|nr:hypothetical protein [Novosphingobium sp.]
MELRPEYLLPVIAKTLQDVVLPVLDSHQQVAQEQLKLAIGFLNIMAQNGPMQFAFDVDELRRLTNHADALAQAVGGNDASNSAIAAAKAAGNAVGIDPAEIVAATRQLRLGVCDLIDQGHAKGDKTLDATIASLVNDFSQIQLNRERAWVLPMGFENGQDAVPSIANQLGLQS